MQKNPIVEMRGDKTRLDFSRQTGLGYCTLQMIERGAVMTMRPRTLEALSRISGRRIEDIAQQYEDWKFEAMKESQRKKSQ